MKCRFIILIKILFFFLQQGALADLDAQLVLAANDNDAKAVKILLESGANPNASNGQSLIVAVYFQRSKIVDLLLKFGADPNVKDGEMFIKACATGDEKMIGPFIQAFGFIGTFKEAGLLEACMRGHGGIARLLRSVNMEEDMRWLSASILPYSEMLQLLAKSTGEAMSAFKEGAVQSIAFNQLDAFIELIDCAGIDLSHSQDLVQVILRSGHYDFVKYAFGQVPSLQDAYLIGLSNYYFQYTRGTRDILSKYIKTKENSYVVEMTLPIVSDEDIITHFSGLVNPGATDTYPQDSKPFTLKDINYELMSPREKVYQKVVEVAKNMIFPT